MGRRTHSRRGPPRGHRRRQRLGFNGGELLAFSIGGCFCNDLRYAADALGDEIGDIAVSVTLDIGGDPPRVRSAEMSVTCPGADAAIARARRESTITNSLRDGIPVTILVD